MYCAENYELSVIGSLIVSPEKLLPIALAKLSPKDFYNPVCKSIFAACASLFLENKPIDFITVLGALGGHEDYKLAIAQAIEMMPTATHAEEYLTLVKENSRRKKAAYWCEELLAQSEDNKDIGVLQDISGKITEALTLEGSEKAVSAKEGIYNFFLTKMQPKDYIKTGFQSLDGYTYIDKGDYIIIGGRPSTGKTAFTCQVALTMAETLNVTYFSLETSSAKLYDRLISCYTHTPLSEIKTAKVQNWARIAEGSEVFGNLKLHVVDAAGWTVAQIKAKAMQLKSDVIFIDYLGLIKAEGKTRYEKTTNISIDLHVMAQNTGITTFALSQLSRNGKDEQPDMSDLRESGQLEQDADVIILFHREKDNERNPDCNNKRDLIIAKNKEGNTGAIHFAFDGSIQRFTEVSNAYSR